jgi:hypothetical protein
LNAPGLQSSTVQASQATEQVALANANQERVQIVKATIVSPIGGVVSSLILTLLLIPNMYLWLAPKELPNSHVRPRPNGHALPYADPQPVGAL